MKRRLAALSVLAVLVLWVSGVAFAHHGYTAYDMKNAVTLKGTITEFRFMNPHSILSFDVKDENGTVSAWSGELNSPSQLSRMGVNKGTFKLNDPVTISGFPAKNGTKLMALKKIVSASGQEYVIIADRNEGQ